eukprot:2408232-Pleurochrysis_carterae.AAC.1
MTHLLRTLCLNFSAWRFVGYEFLEGETTVAALVALRVVCMVWPRAQPKPTVGLGRGKTTLLADTARGLLLDAEVLD